MKRASLTAFFLSLVVHGCGLFISIVTFIKPPPNHKNQKLHTTKPTTKTAATSELKSSEFFPVDYFVELGKTKTCKTSIEIPFAISSTTRNVGIWQSNRYCFIAIFLSAKELEIWMEKSNCGLMHTCIWSRHIHQIVAVHIPFLCNYETPKQQRDA